MSVSTGGPLQSHCTVLTKSEYLTKPTQLAHSASLASQGVPRVFYPSAGGNKWAHTLSAFYVSCKAPNSGPLKCTAMVLTTEPTPQSSLNKAQCTSIP